MNDGAFCENGADCAGALVAAMMVVVGGAAVADSGVRRSVESRSTPSEP